MSDNNGKGFLSREQILAVQDLTIEEVYVPQWGGSVRIRSLTALQRGRLEVSTLERKGRDADQNLIMLRARMVALSIVDESGTRVFSERDVESLNDKSASALETVFKAAMRLSGLSKEDVDELTKNSESAPSAASSSS
jgi:hypothetical protein